MEPLSNAILSPLFDEAAKKSISSAFDFLAKKYSLRNLNRFKKNYLDYCEKVLSIKTLISPDKIYHVDNIYVPIDIKQSGTQTRIKVGDLTALDNDKALLIKGIAGQGKSTLLRKLLSNNSKRFQRLPIFYELKNYTGGTIESAIVASLKNYGINIEEYALTKLLSDSNVKVYLDAFDETKPEYRSRLLDQIRRLVNSFNCHVICTSRPDTEIDTLSELETYTTCELTEEQIFGIIHKATSDQEKSKELCEALKVSPLHTKEDSILKSPILVILFCVSYNLGEAIPNTLSQFYSNIFDTVFHRHDNIKGKVHRERYWNDNRKIYKDLFSCLCYLSLYEGHNSFQTNKFIDFISTSLELIDEDTGPSEKIAMELASITNLIIEDGYNEYKFVHKSIQEFFAASFIMTLQHKKKTDFYQKCYNDYSFYSLFSDVLFFLEELDYYDYNEYGFIPAISTMYGVSNIKKSEDIKVTEDLQQLFLDKCFMRIKISKFKSGKLESYDVNVEKFSFEVAHEHPSLYTKIFNFGLDYLKLEFSEKEIFELNSNHGEKTEGNFKKISLRNALIYKGISILKVNDTLQFSFDVLLRRNLEKAIDKLKNRNKSLNNKKYFDFT